MVNGRISEFFGDSGITVGDLADEDLNDFYAYLNSEELTAATTLRYHGLFHVALAYC